MRFRFQSPTELSWTVAFRIWRTIQILEVLGRKFVPGLSGLVELQDHRPPTGGA